MLMHSFQGVNTSLQYFGSLMSVSRIDQIPLFQNRISWCSRDFSVDEWKFPVLSSV